MKYYIQTTNYETIEIDNEWIIMNTDKYTVTKLNVLGGICWTLLKQPQTITSLITYMSEKYEFENELHQNDIEAFLLELMQYGLVKHAV
ncbi:PqqD family protein [Metabacillus sediminilitoris]|uniref:PqqD family protein n=1 Tax=Metabacillus sediminilitoris TaxID=2567941 RepID=A0A4S4BZ39_9BACI|nr:PqqD family protein [Metabacillus sediminilitoris]QGQ47203.1 PqqD family peptide modification chaperone [Metabacillus sediminilitoris]THF80547.1 PqqD family protein [Metabacillus sediminilitoris]